MQAAQQPSPAVPAPRLAHYGTGGDLFAITLANLLFKVLTLGVYHFWGKTRVRRYLWSQTAFAGERFEYTGRGLELLIGYVIAMALIAVLVALWQYLTAVVQAEPVLATVAGLSGYAGVVFLAGVGRYNARRYQLSRTRWRGVRFALGGSALRHGLLTLGHGLLALATLGLTWPYMRNHLTGHLLRHVWFGDLRMTYDGRGGALLRRYLAAWALALGVVGGVAALVALANLGLPGNPGDDPARPAAVQTLAVLVPLLFLAVFPLLGLAWLWYQAGEWRHFAAHARLGPLTFRADVPAWPYVRLVAGNLLLTVLTFGLGYAWVLVRTARFACRHLLPEGELDAAAISQSRQTRPRMGEGLAEAFDLGGV